MHGRARTRGGSPPGAFKSRPGHEHGPGNRASVVSCQALARVVKAQPAIEIAGWLLEGALSAAY